MSLLLPLLTQAALININTAPSSELQTLTGIGPAYAQRIIDYRSQKGPFQRIDDIKNVSGIGDATFAKIKDFITIGDSSASEPPPAGATTSTEGSVLVTDAGTADTSAHYSSIPLTSLEPAAALKIGAGRNRLGVVDASIEFKASSNMENDGRVVYTWNFGDGTEGYGPVVGHAYAYPGDYAVVLNAVSPSGPAASRIDVKIAPASISITHAGNDRVELYNSGKAEINLFGREISANGQNFAFPKDTIIKAGQKISYPSVITRLYPQSAGEVALRTAGSKAEAVIMAPVQAGSAATVPAPKVDQAKIDSIYDEILALERKEIELKNSQSMAAPAVSLGSSGAAGAQIATSTDTAKAESWMRTVKRFFGFR